MTISTHGSYDENLILNENYKFLDNIVSQYQNSNSVLGLYNSLTDTGLKGYVRTYLAKVLDAEKAVALFLDKRIKFLQIYDLIDACMKAHNLIDNPNLQQILDTEQWVYNFIDEMNI